MSISGVLHVVVVVGLVQLVFAVLGLQLFMGKMHHCSADTCCSAPGVCQVSMRWWCVLPACIWAHAPLTCQWIRQALSQFTCSNTCALLLTACASSQ